MTGARWAVAGLALVLASAVAFAQPPDPAKQLDAKRQQLRDAEQRSKSVQQELADLAREREQINSQLIETGRAIQKSEAALTELESRLAQNEVQERSVKGSLASRHDQIATLMAAMQRMGRNPPPVIITRREDALEMVRSAMLLARAFPELKQQAEELAGQLNELLRVISEITRDRDAEQKEKLQLEEKKSRLTALLEIKRQTLAERNKELEDLRKLAQALGRETNSLAETLSRLDRTVAERTGLGAYEAEIRARETAPAAAAGPGDPPAPPAAPSKGTDVALAPPPKAIEIAPRGDAATANAGRLRPSVVFTSAKGRLPVPAVGKQVLKFGQPTQFGGQSKGIVIETRHSAQVVSPADGWIVYAGSFRSYGQLLIINPGSGYHILLAGMHQIDVQLGQFVLASEPVGTMAPAPKRASQDSLPVLYVEFRKDQRSIDPEPWWIADSVQKVQG